MGIPFRHRAKDPPWRRGQSLDLKLGVPVVHAGLMELEVNEGRSDSESQQIELTPDEARSLAAALVRMAFEIEAQT